MLRSSKRLAALVNMNLTRRPATNAKPSPLRRYCRIANKQPFTAHPSSKTKDMVLFDGLKPTPGDNELDQIANELWIVPAFITPEEEQQLGEEINPLFKKKRYIDTHWDGVITGYKEIEKSFWVRFPLLLVFCSPSDHSLS